MIVAGQPSIGVLFQADQDQTDMPSTIAIMIVILILGVIVDVAVRPWPTRRSGSGGD